MSQGFGGFNIDDFIGAYDDYARAYLFYCQINSNNFNEPNHRFLVSASSLPTETLEEIVTNWQGNDYKLASTSTYEDFEITFKLPRNANVRKQFIDWKNKIHNPETNIHGNPREYMDATINLQLLDNEGNGVMEYKLNKCWPAVIGSIELDYSSKEMITFPVTFKYVYHTSE